MADLLTLDGKKISTYMTREIMININRENETI